VIATRALVKPCVLLAIALLVLNDHVLKSAAPGAVTGKLSDVAGLVFFPLLLAAAAETFGVRHGMRTVVAATVATGVAFAAIKLSASAGDVYRVGLAILQWPARAIAAVVGREPLPGLGHVSLVRDPSDLVALVALTVPILVVAQSARCGPRGCTKADDATRAEIHPELQQVGPDAPVAGLRDKPELARDRE
jgi:hypothetical protein